MRRIHQTTVALMALLALTGCQTANVGYEKIGYGPDLDYARAKCEIASMGTEQSVYAFGSPGYVLGNAIRKQEFMRTCMILQGWGAGRATSGSSKSAGATKAASFSGLKYSRSNANKALTDDPYAAASRYANACWKDWRMGTLGTEAI